MKIGFPGFAVIIQICQGVSFNCFFLDEKMGYIHQNQVKTELVMKSKNYLYSSAWDYEGGKGIGCPEIGKRLSGQITITDPQLRGADCKSAPAALNNIAHIRRSQDLTTII